MAESLHLKLLTTLYNYFKYVKAMETFKLWIYGLEITNYNLWILSSNNVKKVY